MTALAHRGDGAGTACFYFKQVWEICGRYVDQGGGKRKGAFAIYLEPWHADIFDWLELRKNHGKEEVGPLLAAVPLAFRASDQARLIEYIQGLAHPTCAALCTCCGQPSTFPMCVWRRAPIICLTPVFGGEAQAVPVGAQARARDLFYGLWTTDLFMQRVEANGEWSLFCPSEAPGLADCWGEEHAALYARYEREGRAKKVVKAQQLWFAILEAQARCCPPCSAHCTFSGMFPHFWHAWHEQALMLVCPSRFHAQMMFAILILNVSPFRRWRRGTRTCCTRTRATARATSRTWARSRAATCARRSSSSRRPRRPPSATWPPSRCRATCASRTARSPAAAPSSPAPSTPPTGASPRPLHCRPPPTVLLSPHVALHAAGLPAAEVPLVRRRYFDFDKLREVTRIVTQNLNKIIDINYYPAETARRSNMRHRPIGIGVQVAACLVAYSGNAITQCHAHSVLHSQHLPGPCI